MNTLHDDRIRRQRHDTRERIPERIHADAAPAGERRLVEGHVAVVADPAVTAVDPTDFFDAFGNLIRPERMRKAVLPLRHPQSGIDPAEQLAAHETHKAQRMALRDEPTLPVQKLVHLEYMDAAPTNPLAIRDLSEQRVVLRRPHRKNQSARLAALIPGLNPVRDRAREVVEQSLRVRQ